VYVHTLVMTTTMSTDDYEDYSTSDEYVPTTEKKESLLKKTKDRRSVRKPAERYSKSPLCEEKIEEDLEVDIILAHRMDPKTSEMQYRVKWKGLNNRYNKWIRSSDLKYDEAIRKYHDSIRTHALDEALKDAMEREREFMKTSQGI